MASFTSTKSGNWSDTTVWGGGPPGSSTSDTVTIAAGHTVTYNYTNAVALSGLTINGHLVASTTAGTYVLNMAGLIQGGTTGSLEANGAGTVGDTTVYPLTCQFNIVFSGANYIYCLNGLQLSLYCAQPTNKYARLISSTSKPITNITNANPCVVTCTGHGYSNGTVVYLTGIVGMTPINNNVLQIANVTTNTFSLQWNDPGLDVVSTDTTLFPAYVSGGLVCPQQANAIGNTVLNVDTDLTGDTCWTSTLGSKLVAVVDNTRPGYQSYACELLTISSISSTTITLTSGITQTKKSGSWILLMQRNIRITGVNGSVPAIDTNGYSVLNVIGAEFTNNTCSYWPGGMIRNNNTGSVIFSGTCYGGVGSYHLGSVISGVACAGGGMACGTNITVSGIIAGCNQACLEGGGHSVTGSVFGSFGVFNYARNSIISGEMNGCNGMGIGSQNCASSGIIRNCSIASGWSTRGTTFSGFIYGCGAVLAGYSGSADDGIFSGICIGCGNAMTYCNHIVVSGKILSCTNGINVCMDVNINGATIDRTSVGIQNTTGIMSNTTISNSTTADIYVNVYNSGDPTYYCTVMSLRGCNSELKSATKFSNYNLVSVPANLPNCGFYNYDPIISGVSYPGRIQAFTPGGTIVNNETPPASPPVALSYTHKYTFSLSSQASTISADYPLYSDIPVGGKSGIPISIMVYLKKSVNSMSETPRVQLIDTFQLFDSSASKLVDTAMADNTNWQTISINYTPTITRPLVLRVRGTNASGTLDWNYTQSAGERSFSFGG